ALRPFHAALRQAVRRARTGRASSPRGVPRRGAVGCFPRPRARVRDRRRGVARVPRVDRRAAASVTGADAAVSGPASPADILILGTGAMGSLLAARLARGGAARVTVAGTWAEGLETIGRHGITVEDDSGCWSVPVATATLSHPGKADFVLVLVKSTRTAAVAGTAARAVDPGGSILSLQNGLGNIEVLARAAGHDRLAVGVATLGATLLAPGRVRAFPGRIDIGATRPR